MPTAVPKPDHFVDLIDSVAFSLLIIGKSLEFIFAISPKPADQIGNPDRLFQSAPEQARRAGLVEHFMLRTAMDETTIGQSASVVSQVSPAAADETLRLRSGQALGHPAVQENQKVKARPPEKRR
jgi:hypothetical protein